MFISQVCVRMLQIHIAIAIIIHLHYEPRNVHMSVISFFLKFFHTSLPTFATTIKANGQTVDSMGDLRRLRGRKCECANKGSRDRITPNQSTDQPINQSVSQYGVIFFFSQSCHSPWTRLRTSLCPRNTGIRAPAACTHFRSRHAVVLLAFFDISSVLLTHPPPIACSFVFSSRVLWVSLVHWKY